MIQIFISHAGADVQIAERLAQDLKNAGHETKVDTRELRLGSDSIDFMNQSIADADAVLILHSKHTPEATWQQLEMNAALWNEIAQNGGKCIIIRLDDTPLPPLLGPKVYGKIDPTTPELYQKLLEDLAGPFCRTRPSPPSCQMRSGLIVVIRSAVFGRSTSKTARIFWREHSPLQTPSKWEPLRI